jgi:2-amino-4-hydroxy-6-hydroxymethyldihydropteridine diphosphokinase
LGIAYVALGANLADPVAQVEGALAELDGIPGTRVTARSSLYLTAPVGLTQQPDFINAAARLETSLGPVPLLDALLEIEKGHGRVRSVPNAPRTLDLDLLLYGEARIDSPRLVVPHPRMNERAFVLVPLAEIAPDAEVPGRGRVRDLLAARGADGVRRLAAPGG